MPNEVVNARIIMAMEKLWTSVLVIREFGRRFTTFQSLLLPEEYDKIIAGKLKGIVPIMSQEEFHNQMVTLDPGVESERPFVGEAIWSLYYIYRAFTVRQALKVQDGLEKKKLQVWNKDFQGKHDSATERMLGTIFTQEELLQFDAGDGFGATTKIMNAIEVRLLNEMNDWIFNRHFHKIDVEKQEAIQNSITVGGDFNIGGDFTGDDKAISNRNIRPLS